ncbi:MAG TPA: PQQ-binding-like beta-propeller repeat protein, partial [Gaiellaceae bacterium]|nr:PQQ-binding-like beta-propeller repeat protein [Gaiellaceae bacterium]
TGALHALDLATGQEAPGWPVQVVADTSGELVWGGLTMSGDKLYVPVASYCDVPDLNGAFATGRLMAVDLDTRSVVATFQVVPDAPNSMGGIWGWGGASLDPLTGDLWAATGNSWFYDLTCGCISQTAGYSESVVALDPNMNVLAVDRPDTVPGENDDADFGSTPLLFQPPGCPPLAAAYAKTGYIYVWLRDSLSGGPIWSFLGGPSDISNAFVGEPSYSADLNELIVADARAYDDTGTITHFDAVTGFAFGPGCSLPDEPTWTAPDLGRGPKAPALIVGGIAFVVGGYVPGVFALDAANGAALWSTELPQAVLAPPAFGNDQVYVADTSGVVEAIGVGPAPPPPPPPVELTAGKAALTAARAGKPFTVSFLLRNNGDPVEGAVRCSGKLAGDPLRILRHASATSGKTSCTWTMPASAHGKRFAGAVSATYKGTKVTRSFSTTVR